MANHFSLNSLALGFEKIFRFLQLPDQLFDLRNRRSANLLNKWRGMRVSFRYSPDWLKIKDPDAPAVKREAEEDWDEMTRRVHRKSEAVRF